MPYMRRIEQVRGPAWEIHWRVDGARGCRRFRTEAEALAFLPLVPKSTRQAPPVCDVIRSHVAVDENGCWNWTLKLHKKTGYARIQIAGQVHLAHRLSYESFVGPIPEGLQIDHLCRNRGCANPEHLEPVTSRENSARSPINFVGVNIRKTRCKNDHPFDDGNTRIRRNGGRECKTCRREITRRYRERQAFRAAGIEAAA